jgi:hypothetical protein
MNPIENRRHCPDLGGPFGHTLDMNSRVHPKYKTRYRVSNWTEYDRALGQRGDITLWKSEGAIEDWKPAASGARGEQRKFSDHANETALMLWLVFKLPPRQAEGFLRSILSLMDIDLEAPDHTTLSRRSRCLHVKLALVVSSSPIHLIVDSTGLSIIGEGEWAAVKHCGRGKRAWKKLHLGDLAFAIAQSDESGRSGIASGTRNRDTTSRLAWRTPLSEPSQSWVVGFVRVIRNHSKGKE